MTVSFLIRPVFDEDQLKPIIEVTQTEEDGTEHKYIIEEDGWELVVDHVIDSRGGGFEG